MIDLVKRILGSRPAGGAGPEDEEREKHRVPVAACALLLEMAHIDGEFTEAERRLIVSILEHDFGLEADEAAAAQFAHLVPGQGRPAANAMEVHHDDGEASPQPHAEAEGAH